MKANFMTSLRPIILPRAAGMYLWQKCCPARRAEHENAKPQSAGAKANAVFGQRAYILLCPRHSFACRIYA